MKHSYSVLGYPPHDRRLDVSRHTNSIFPITCFSSREEVEKRREELRFNLRMAAGLYPYPEKTPLNTKYEDVGTFDGYCIKKVMLWYKENGRAKERLGAAIDRIGVEVLETALASDDLLLRKEEILSAPILE